MPRTIPAATLPRPTMMPAGWLALVIAVAAVGSWASPAAAQGCDSTAVGARFTEAAALCADHGGAARAPTAAATATVTATPGMAPASQAIVTREPVSVQMTGYRRRLAQAVARVEAQRGPVDNRLLTAVGQRYRIDPRLLASIVHAESAGRAGAVSNKGALGLMQVMPGTARGLGVRDPRRLLGDPALALSTGAVYLKQLQRQFGNNVPLVLAAYNAGPGAVVRAGRRVPRYRETQGYVAKIMGRYATPRAAARR